MKRVFLAVFVILSVMLCASVLYAQETGSLTGVVTDNSGAVIQDVAVKLRDTKTNASYTAKTNSVGAYTFVKLLPGPGYQLAFTKEGFDSLTVSNVYVGVGATHTENVQMQIGAITQTVEVSAQGQAVSLDTTDTTIGNNFDIHMVHELPIQGRDSPAALLALQPGVVTAHAGTDDPSNSREGAVTGARADQSNITLDGLDVNDFATGQAFATSGNAPVDSIQEFRGETANPLASSGRGSGAQIQLVTQSGSNSWHGGLYEYHRNTITEANNLFNARAGVATPKLIRNQFGGKVGGPIVKDKLFFFFNYYARRDASEDSISTTVPLDSFRDGNLGYINNSPGCTFQSRQNSTPACISFKTPADIQALDPASAGVNSGLLSFVTGRYPRANDLTLGDGVNTGGFRFNAPLYRSENDYVGRVDYNLNEKMKLFGRISIVRDTSGDDSNGTTVQFPGDPVSHQIIDRSYAYVIGHTWTISPSKVNNFFYGETRSNLDFPTTFNPVGANVWTFGPIVAPYSEQSSQHRIVPVPVFRDDFTWVKGKHNFQMGGTFKPIMSTTTLVRDFNNVSVGLGGLLDGLDATLRPTDILSTSATARSDWDSAFPFMLGRLGEVFTRFDNDHNLQALPSGTGHTRKYRYYETEAYFQDTWRVRDDLTMTYGLRYQFYSVPYETGGLEAIPSLGPADFYNPRVALGLSGTLQYPDLLGPLVAYNFGGKVNHAAGLYQPDWKDFAPRLAFSYNPGAEKGILGKLFGNRKTVIRTGAGIVFDHTTTSALNFIQDQSTYIFQGSNTNAFGVNGDPRTSLQNDPRFSDINTIPTPPTEDPVTLPFTPAIDGTATTGLSNYAIDPKLKTPYSIAYSFGIQRELPGNFLFEANYFGRLGRRLLGQADAGQYVDYQDQFTPGHSLAGDFFAITKELRSGVDPTATLVTPQPFFEDFFGPGGTQFIAENFQTLTERGDLTDVLVGSGLAGGLPGVGLSPQFGANVYVTNKGFSSYNALLTTLHKRLSHGLQFDINYTFSHSLDNVSVTANNAIAVFPVISGNMICDFTNLRACRGNSDFDVKHIISGDFIYELPFGRGKSMGANMPGWANQMFGGWQISGIPSWRSGFAFTTVSGAFPISFYNNSPAVFVGNQSDIKTKIHDDPATGIQVFANQTNAIGAFRGPLGLEGGSRNNLRGPGYTNLDLGVAKHFPIGERFIVEFRADAYNVFNHVNFGLPDSGGAGGFADITDASSFGVINTAAAPRQMQFALRLDF